MANPIKRKTKSGIHYQVQIRLSGYPALTKTFSNKADAIRWKRTKEAELIEGRCDVNQLATKYTVADVVDRYIDTELQLTQNVERYKQAVKRQLLWWKDRVGAYRLDSFNEAVVCDARNELRQRLAPSTVRSYMSVLSTALTSARDEWHWVAVNVVEKVSKPKLPEGNTRFLNPEKELPKLLDACKAVDKNHIYLIVVCAIQCGARFSELLSLQVNDCHFNRDDEGFILLRAERTKAKKERKLVFTGAVYQLLREHVKAAPARCDYVFYAKSGNMHVNIRRVWEQVRRRAGLYHVGSPNHLRFHDLRHSCASYLAMSGAGLSDIQHTLGHSNIKMTARYSHLTEKHTVGVSKKMGAEFLTDI